MAEQEAGPGVPTEGDAGGSPVQAGAPRRRLRRRSLREERVHLRFSPQEMEDIRRAAAASRMTPAGYVAEAGLAAARSENPEAAVADYRRTVKELMESNRQAAALGNNLNQLTYHLNRSGGPLPEQAVVHRLSKRVDDVLDAIDQAVESLVRR
ncbi:plasmid mobilization protein [Streptomyces nanshensis]|uniref:Mobilization protein n=1 Tax=Streptomyces nanshensis TaxID=518642 RepID=A0A1E7LAC6_9ACTN|nr:plasmid mobilization relaxosome protein MobC [Streptomyces nanshensis]OEV13149.1 mobilization protein [Streptomyces nanshensis]